MDRTFAEERGGGGGDTEAVEGTAGQWLSGPVLAIVNIINY